MKVGFAVQTDQGLDSTVYDHFGSAPAFLIVDTDEEQLATVDNANTHEAH